MLPVGFTEVVSALASKLFQNVRDHEKIKNDCFDELFHLTKMKAAIEGYLELSTEDSDHCLELILPYHSIMPLTFRGINLLLSFCFFSQIKLDFLVK